MQKIIIVFLVVLAIVQPSKIQENETITLLTSGKWYLEYVIMEGERLDFAPEMQQNNWMLFYPKGKATYKLQGKQVNARWEYDTSNQILKLILGEEIKEHKLVTVTEKQLILEEFGEEQSMIGYRK